MQEVINTKTVTGTHTLTNKKLTYLVEVLVDTQKTEMSGKWIVKINGKAIRWYGMESAAIRCFNRAKVGAYGITFGECF